PTGPRRPGRPPRRTHDQPAVAQRSNGRVPTEKPGPAWCIGWRSRAESGTTWEPAYRTTARAETEKQADGADGRRRSRRWTKSGKRSRRREEAGSFRGNCAPHVRLLTSAATLSTRPGRRFLDPPESAAAEQGH